MKKLALSVLAAVLLISACKKDDNETAANSFSVNGKTVVTNYGYLFDYNAVDGKEIYLSDVNVTPAYVGKISLVSFSIDSLIDGASYTLLSDDSASYDKTKNFSDASVVYQADFKDETSNDTTGTWYEEPKAGTLTIKKNGDNYLLGYSLTFATTTITGKFNGKLTPKK